MDDKQLDLFRTRISEDLRGLETEDTLGTEAQKTVTLDQQSVGRLSRMDALQQQAMAKATQTRRNQMRQRLQAALQRIDGGEFGYCQDCGDDIPFARLDLDPTVARCVSCIRG